MLIFVVAASALTVAYAQDAAVVYLFDPSGKSGVTGNVTFAKASNGIEITGEIHGLTEGKHGFHIHKLGHIAPGCLGTGGHFNPHNKNHGAPEDKIRHVGDLGNIEADSSGVAHIKILDKVVALDGENCIIGRAVVVHEKEDDLGKGTNPDSLVTGNAGGRVACGVIGIQSESAAVGIYSSTTLLAASIISISFYKYVK